ncbi:acyl-CoA N-acyltransferase [Xylaria nigripes]|nr:acyl-CoA N-acyltransferase [Xylaria nigripes]
MRFHLSSASVGVASRLPFPHPSVLPPGFTMTRCTPADVQDMDAFANSEYAYWWGPIPTMWSWQEEYFRRRFADPSAHQFKVVDDSNGVIVAWAEWDTPPRMTGLSEGLVTYDEAGEQICTSGGEDGIVYENTRGKDEPEGGMSAKRYAQKPPEGSNIPHFEKFVGGMTSMENKYQASEKLVLGYICTRHSYHGRGIGTALLRSVLDIADKEGIPAFLEASRVGVSLYRRIGFVKVETLELDHDVAGFDTPATVQIMVREPR